ncbi:twin-arginine translocation signal domain-containing protein, partial [Streptomyces sp. NRRL WC-3774]
MRTTQDREEPARDAAVSPGVPSRRRVLKGAAVTAGLAAAGTLA